MEAHDSGSVPFIENKRSLSVGAVGSALRDAFGFGADQAPLSASAVTSSIQPK
jgi:hypothetical protein